MATKATDAFDEYRRNGMIAAGKKRVPGTAERVLDKAAFPDVISIDSTLLD